MLLSGSSSYYDEYVRKKGTGRTLNDPPSLLTDRGAYVNFLEVQLERVSAACLGVQAYDQRFNDLQQLIITLEQRCGNTTRLVALAQHCTEEMRNETNKKIHEVESCVKENYKTMQQVHEAASSRVSLIEQSLVKLTELTGRVSILEEGFKAQTENFQVKITACEEENKRLHSRIDAMLTAQERMQAELETQRATSNKLTVDMFENERKSFNLITATEKKLSDVIARDADEAQRKIHAASCRLAGEVEAVQKDVSAKDQGVQASIRRTHENIQKELDVCRRELLEFIERSSSRCSERCSEELKSVQVTLASKIIAIENMAEESSSRCKDLHGDMQTKFAATQTVLDKTKDSVTLVAQKLDTLRSDFNQLDAAVSATLNLQEVMPSCEEHHDAADCSRSSHAGTARSGSGPAGINGFVSAHQGADWGRARGADQRRPSAQMKSESISDEYYRASSKPAIRRDEMLREERMTSSYRDRDEDEWHRDLRGDRFQRRTVNDQFEKGAGESDENISSPPRFHSARGSHSTEAGGVHPVNPAFEDIGVRSVLGKFLDVYQSDQSELKKKLNELRDKGSQVEAPRNTDSSSSRVLLSRVSSTEGLVDGVDGQIQVESEKDQSKGSASVKAPVPRPVRSKARVGDAAASTVDASQPNMTDWRRDREADLNQPKNHAWLPTRNTQPRTWPLTTAEHRLPIHRENTFDGLDSSELSCASSTTSTTSDQRLLAHHQRVDHLRGAAAILRPS